MGAPAVQGIIQDLAALQGQEYRRHDQARRQDGQGGKEGAGGDESGRAAGGSVDEGQDQQGHLGQGHGRAEGGEDAAVAVQVRHRGVVDPPHVPQGARGKLFPAGGADLAGTVNAALFTVIPCHGSNG